MKKCIVCKTEDVLGNRKTCSKKCKNELASQITTAQFSDPAAREIQRQKSIAQKKDPKYQAIFQKAIDARTERWAKIGHPRKGLKQSESCKDAIGAANKGRFKGKTWEEIYGKEVAARRRIENSIFMSGTNETLLKDRRSKLEEKLLPILKNYKNNVQISYYNVDFINEETKHIIEVNGDYWHCNPKIYSDDFMHPFLKMTAKQKQTLDNERKIFLESLGYSVTTVWESDLNEFIANYKEKHK